MIVPINRKQYGKAEIDAAIDAIKAGVWTEHDYARKFANSINEFIGTNYCQLVNSGSSANLIALNALKIHEGWKEEDEIITCGLAFPTTVNPILQLNLTPIFVDSYGLNVDVEALQRAITKRTKAIMLAHTLGFPFNVKEVLKLCHAYDLKLIEDNCDAYGSKYNGRMCGTFGDISTMSFYPAHCITAIEGGAVSTDNAELFKIARSLVNWGRDCHCLPGHDDTCGQRFTGKFGKLPKGYDHKYVYTRVGYNLKITDIQAAIGFVQMQSIQARIKKRQINYQDYAAIFKSANIDYIELQEGVNPFGFAFYSANAMKTARYLEENGVGVRLLFGGNITRQPYLCGKAYGVLPNADEMMMKTCWIGVQPGLTDEHKQHVSKVIQNIPK